MMLPLGPARVKCLLVDDREENLLVLSALLRHDDVELLEASSGAEALELLLRHDVALAFLDVQMPEMDGFELAELMRGTERTRHVPLIFVTAGSRDQRRMFKGYDAGAVDFLYKPIDAHVLRSKAAVFFQLHRQRQQLLHELRERTEALRLNEMFAAVLGHDLRNPLNAIVTSAHLLQQLSTDERVREVTARMLSSGTRMNRMIEDLLDVTRARLGPGIPINRASADLGALLHRVVQEHRTAAPDCQIELRHDGEMVGEWDADRLAQVASNLIGNALQHGTHGERVRVDAAGTAVDTVTVSVINAGRIDDEVLPHIFDPFSGGHARMGPRGGLGLGLYIAQQIVRAHAGTLEVHTEGTTHTVFRVSVPRSAATARMAN